MLLLLFEGQISDFLRATVGLANLNYIGRDSTRFVCDFGNACVFGHLGFFRIIYRFESR
jgi:hypothetical protein